ncbi:MAG: hypothetical protein R3C68_17230 [Myxococcota bacterium]
MDKTALALLADICGEQKKPRQSGVDGVDVAPRQDWLSQIAARRP